LGYARGAPLTSHQIIGGIGLVLLFLLMLWRIHQDRKARKEEIDRELRLLRAELQRHEINERRWSEQ
jgi:hypothetical protein